MKQFTCCCPTKNIENINLINYNELNNNFNHYINKIESSNSYKYIKNIFSNIKIHFQSFNETDESIDTNIITLDEIELDTIIDNIIEEVKENTELNKYKNIQKNINNQIIEYYDLKYASKKKEHIIQNEIENQFINIDIKPNFNYLDIH